MKKTRDPIRLTYQGHLSHEQIARALSVSKGAVGKYVSRIVARGLEPAALLALDRPVLTLLPATRYELARYHVSEGRDRLPRRRRAAPPQRAAHPRRAAGRDPRDGPPHGSPKDRDRLSCHSTTARPHAENRSHQIRTTGHDRRNTHTTCPAPPPTPPGTPEGVTVYLPTTHSKLINRIHANRPRRPELRRHHAEIRGREAIDLVAEVPAPQRHAHRPGSGRNVGQLQTRVPHLVAR